MRTAWIGALLLIAGKSFSLETHAIPAADLARKVSLRRLADFVNSPDAGVRTADFGVARDQNYDLAVESRDRSGAPWRLTLPASIHGLWVTVAAGAKTYFFAGSTGGAGMAPPAWVIALSLDEQGRPVPFCARGWAQYGNDGIEDLVDLDGTGPELIQQDFIETHDVPDVRSGYYVTTLYQQRGYYWYRVDGRHGAKVFPIFERYILGDNRPQEVSAPAGSSGWLRDYGNDPRHGSASSCQF